MNLTKILTKEKRNHTNTHNTPHKNAACHTCLMLASTIQFSHNTPTTPHQHTHSVSRHNGQAPKKGDNAPDTQQCTNIQTNTLKNVHGQHVCHKAPFKHSVFVLKVYLPPGNFQTNNVGSMTLAHSTNTLPQTHDRKRAQLCPTK